MQRHVKIAATAAIERRRLAADRAHPPPLPTGVHAARDVPREVDGVQPSALGPSEE
jgi:hypothetical protein